MKHKKMIEQWYELDFVTSHRYLGGKIDDLLEGAPELDEDEDLANEKWEDTHAVLRDYDGDFSGILIYHNDTSKPVIEFICKKIGVDYEEVKDLNFKLIG